MIRSDQTDRPVLTDAVVSLRQAGESDIVSEIAAMIEEWDMEPGAGYEEIAERVVERCGTYRSAICLTPLDSLSTSFTPC